MQKQQESLREGLSGAGFSGEAGGDADIKNNKIYCLILNVI
jgi:hypothetical protein